MSWAAARKVSAPVGEAAAVAAGVPGAETGTPGELAELVATAGALAVLAGPAVLEAGEVAELAEEPQAVVSTAIPASDAQAATCLALGDDPIMSNPSNA
jgi:hypothetical protein